jgi:hypothetical protein
MVAEENIAARPGPDVSSSRVGPTMAQWFARRRVGSHAFAGRARHVVTEHPDQATMVA